MDTPNFNVSFWSEDLINHVRGRWVKVYYSDISDFWGVAIYDLRYNHMHVVTFDIGIDPIAELGFCFLPNQIVELGELVETPTAYKL